MSKLVYSALALTLVSTPSIASENEWSSLDQEIANLSASFSAQNAPGPKLGGFMRMSWRNSSDFDSSGPGTNESGFKLDKVRIEITGDAGADYSYKISFELSSGAASLRDAYVTWKVADTVTGEMGRFRQPFLRSSLITDKNLLFLQRTALGDFFGDRDDGLMFFGAFDTISWWIAGQNSNDGKGDDYLYTGRLTANLMGTGAGKVEGAYGGGDDGSLTLGLAYADKQDLDKGTTIALEANFTHGPFSISGEMVDFDKGDTGTTWTGKDIEYSTPNNSNAGLLVDPADSTPWDLTASFLFSDVYEAAIRYEDADDTNNITRWVAGINRYIQGHDIKWSAQWMSVKSDVNADEFDELGIGLTVAF